MNDGSLQSCAAWLLSLSVLTGCTFDVTSPAPGSGTSTGVSAGSGESTGDDAEARAGAEVSADARGGSASAGRSPAGVRAPVLSSGSTCPPNSTLTYDSFGEPFFMQYCVKCHTSAPTGSPNKAAPVRSFDNVAVIRMLARQIDEHAAAGPAGTYEIMPPVDPRPTKQERLALGEWLSCGAP